MSTTLGRHRPSDPYTHVRKIGRLFWSWYITAGPLGPTLIGPNRAWTERGAYRAAATALSAREAEARS